MGFRTKDVMVYGYNLWTSSLDGDYAIDGPRDPRERISTIDRHRSSLLSTTVTKMQHLSIVQVVGNTGDFVGRKSAMSQHGDSIGLVGKLKTKYYARRARRREAKRLREIMGGQSIYNWRRGKQELLLQKLLQREESSLHTDSRSVSHDTSQRSYTLQDQPSATSAKPTTPKVEKPFDETLHFSFSGGGWLMVYMYGVAKALREQKLHENAKFIGTSAGCLSIVSLVLDSDFDAICDSVINDYVPAAHATWWGPFNMREYLVDAITHHANVNKMDRLNDKVTVVYTSLSGWISRRVSNFKNPIHLLHTMVASCCATPLVGLPFEHEGEFVIDGGLLDNQPLFDSVPTITVSPNIFSDADIRPSRYVPAWWSMYPPSQRDMQWLYDLGYEDALSWCVRQAFPGSERIVVPTTAAEYDGEWKTVVGKVVGYRWVEDMVHVAMKMLDISEEMLERNALRMEILFWKMMAVATTILDWMTLVWAASTTITLATLAMIDPCHSLQFGVVFVAQSVVAFMRCKHAFDQVNSSERWQVLQESIVAMDKSRIDQSTGVSYKQTLTQQQHETLLEASYIYCLNIALQAKK